MVHTVSSEWKDVLIPYESEETPNLWSLSFYTNKLSHTRRYERRSESMRFSLVTYVKIFLVRGVNYKFSHIVNKMKKLM